MAKISKRMKAIRSQVVPGKAYSLDEALEILKQSSKLKFVDEPVRTSAASGTGTTGAANRPANAPATTTVSARSKWYPDHALLSGASKDQLKSMPQFKFD